MEWNPHVKISFVHTHHGRVAVVRDDLLKGGTKQRAAIPFLSHLVKQGIEEFVYASPFSGYAQIALAYSCEAIGARCTIFAEKENDRVSAFTKSINKIAKIELFDDLFTAEVAAAEYVESYSERYKIPLGFDDPSYREHLRRELSIQWRILCNKLGYVPNRMWLPVGSGTLATVFHNILPSTQIVCVDVGVLPTPDRRINAVKRLKNVVYIRAPEPFVRQARMTPPIPSNVFYDAKLWQFVESNGMPKDLWWNVAG